MVSHWEAYVEDISSEALSCIVENVENSECLPKSIKKQIAKDIKATTTNDLELWKLAGDGWRGYLQDRLTKYKEERDRSFNTPKSEQTKNFISNLLGLEDVTSNWELPDCSVEEAKKKLDKLIEVRGQIAHRGILEETIEKEWLDDYISFMKSLVSKTGGAISLYVKQITGVNILKKPLIP